MGRARVNERQRRREVAAARVDEEQIASERARPAVGHLHGRGQVQLRVLREHNPHRARCSRTFVTVTFTGLPPLAASAASASRRLSFATWLLWSMSLKPSGPPSLLAKKSSSVVGSNMGASCANAKPGLEAIATMDACGPRMSRKSSWKTWKNGAVVLVGLNVDVLRKWPPAPRTANDAGGTRWQRMGVSRPAGEDDVN